MDALPSIERNLSVTVKLYYDLQRASVEPAPFLIALHGYGANKKQMMREAKLIAPAGFVIASLQGFHQHLREPKEKGGPLRFGFGWLTNFRPEESVAVHHKLLLDLIENLTAEAVADANKIFLLGFSQSCALNYRFAFTYPDLLRGVIGICGGLPGDWETSAAYKQTNAAVFHLAGESDEFYPPERVNNYEQRLRRRATTVQFKTYDAPHEIVDSMRIDMKLWLESMCNARAGPGIDGPINKH
ncbi:MAG: alpha/beta hydrolase [Pyrinomonadaceae bacterium]